MRVTCEHTEDGSVVSAGGRLTASQAGRLHQALRQAFERANRVELSLHDVVEADVSFLQLLCAAHRTAAARGVSFSLKGLESAKPVLRLIHEAGAGSGVGCPEGCRWPSGCAAGGDLAPRD